MRILRSLAGILAGFGIFLGMVRWTSGSGLLLSVSLTVAASVLAGYMTAFIAGAHEFPHVAAVGMLMVGTGFIAMQQEGASQPGWYEIAIAGCGPVSAMIGAAVRLLTKPRPGVNSPASRAAR